MLSLVKPTYCNISINPFEIRSSSNLSSLLFTVSTISNDADYNGINSDDCKVESFTPYYGFTIFSMIY